MLSGRKPAPLPKASDKVQGRPHTTIDTGRGTLRFFLGDCLDVMAALPEGSVAAIVTSPPYNLGIRYRSYDDTLPRSRYLQWTEEWVKAAARVLEPDGSLFLNVGAKPTDPWTAMDVAQAARPHLHLQNTLHWIKSIAIDKDATGGSVELDRDLAVGHYKPINSDRFVNDCHEFVFHFTPRGRTKLDRVAIGVGYQDPSNIARWRSGGKNRRCRGNTWFIPYETIQNRDKDRPHPATFPPRLPEYCLRLHGLSRLGLVMDPFLGLGSSAVAAAQLGLDFIGIEMDRHYLDEAIARVKSKTEDRRQGEACRDRRQEAGDRRHGGACLAALRFGRFGLRRDPEPFESKRNRVQNVATRSAAITLFSVSCLLSPDPYTKRPGPRKKPGPSSHTNQTARSEYVRRAASANASGDRRARRDLPV